MQMEEEHSNDDDVADDDRINHDVSMAAERFTTFPWRALAHTAFKSYLDEQVSLIKSLEHFPDVVKASLRFMHRTAESSKLSIDSR